ncbi:coiled-coil domain-containing protein 58-like isoform X2 [Varroa jacobsoni]|uniref:Protein MIX23 n=1 Tax=Varroa destructor TaxID=109461 RepID=A0A7M7JSU6_VARDE|nr:coiled-coil domain-containing protein 58-like isoform X2 [Varroa destructor]XP_022700293.1 coiled-coil domain-containing protein 58-like isoform X2 [Varroa jacobsoni]
MQPYSGDQELLKQSRKIDDNIIYALNTTVPTQSFSNKNDAHETCKDLYRQLDDLYSSRQASIQKCVQYSEDHLASLKAAKEKNPDNIDVLKELKKEQTKHRLFQAELGVEEVIKTRTKKVFHERCRFFYTPV